MADIDLTAIAAAATVAAGRSVACQLVDDPTEKRPRTQAELERLAATCYPPAANPS